MKINKKTCASSVSLRAYGGFELKPLFSVMLYVEIGQVKANLEFLVVDLDRAQPILSLNACVSLGLVKRIKNRETGKNKNIINEVIEAHSPKERLTKEQFLKTYSDIFEGIGSFPDIYSIKIDKNIPGVIKPPRRIPQTLLEQLKIELNTLIKTGIVSKVNEPKNWSSNLVIVQKPDKKLRLCLDPRELNKAIKRDYCLVPTFESLRPKLNEKKFFTVFDIKQGFWHIKLDEPSADLCTFSTPIGYFRFNRLPFGLNCSPEAFIRQNEKVFGDISENNIGIYFDDLIVAAETEEEHDELVKKVAQRAKERNIKFNIDKLQFKKNEVKFLGHIFNQAGVKPDDAQVKALLELETPKNKTELQRLLGMFNYLRDFIPNMSQIVSPLRELLKKETCWLWGKPQEGALQELKTKIAYSPVLRQFDHNKPITIQCDASKDGLGACLMQNKQPIAFASRSLTVTETGYSQIEKELLSLVFAVKKFHYFVWGRKIEAYTDHKPLLSIVTKEISKIPSNRLQKMRIKLMNYEIELKYIPGKEMHVADLLSRNYLKNTGEFETDLEGTVHCINRYNDNLNETLNIKLGTRSDPCLAQVIKYLTIGWPDRKSIPDVVKHYYRIKNELVVSEGILYYENRIVIPANLRPAILKILKSSHLGITKSKLRAKSLFYWPGMLNEVENMVMGCTICEKFRASNQKQTLICHELPNRPFEKIGLDIATCRGKDFLVVMDYFSKWLDIISLRNKTSTEIIAALRTLFSNHGIPEVVIADNMPCSSFEFKNFANAWKFVIKTSSPHYARSNGLAEKAVHIAKNIINKSAEERKDLQSMLLEYRATPIPSLGVAPSQILMSRLIRTKLPVAEAKLIPEVQNDVKTNLIRNRAKYKDEHDKRARRPEVQFRAGENVLIRNIRHKTWTPGSVIKQHELPRSYIVKNANENIVRRNTFHLRPSFSFRKRSQVRPIEEQSIVRVPQPLIRLPTIERDPQSIIRESKPVSREERGMTENEGSSINKENQPGQTRCGRTINKPAWFNDFI